MDEQYKLRKLRALEIIASEMKLRREATEAQTLETKKLRLVLQGVGVVGLGVAGAAAGASNEVVKQLLDTFAAEIAKVDTL